MIRNDTSINSNYKYELLPQYDPDIETPVKIVPYGKCKKVIFIQVNSYKQIALNLNKSPYFFFL